MKNKITLTVLTVLVFMMTFFLTERVVAEDIETTSYSFMYEYLFDYDDTRYGEDRLSYYGQFYVNYTTTDYILIVIQKDNDYGNSWETAWYSPTTGDIIYYANGDSTKTPSGVTVESYGLRIRDEGESEYEESFCGFYSQLSDREDEYVTMLGVSNTAMYHYNNTDYDTLGLAIFNGTTEPALGFDFWNAGNRYDYESVYSSSIVTPEVRYVMLGWGGDTVNDYVVDIKFLLPNLTDNTGYYVELWADIPYGYDTNGNVLYRKRMLDMIEVNTILKQNNVNVPSPDGSGWVTQNYGSYYEIYGTWTVLIPHISANDSIKYNGINMYMRSAYPVSAMKTLVSDYAYFNLNPGDVTKIDEGWQSALPDIHIGVYDTFNEDGPGQKNDDDVKLPNSSDYEYIGGVTDDPGINDTDDDWEFNYSGNWTIEELEEFVNSGFGLDKPNGLIALIGSCLNFLPKEVMTILMFVLSVLVVVALIKIFS